MSTSSDLSAEPVDDGQWVLFWTGLIGLAWAIVVVSVALLGVLVV